MAGCARPTGASVSLHVEGLDGHDEETTVTEKEATTMSGARVGRPAPDFEAPAYYKGEFTTVKLSESVGKGWTLLCFYPGDFTFV